MKVRNFLLKGDVTHLHAAKEGIPIYFVKRTVIQVCGKAISPMFLIIGEEVLCTSHLEQILDFDVK
jgi:hypothetical protein